MGGEVLRYHPRPPGCTQLEALLLCALEVRQGHPMGWTRDLAVEGMGGEGWWGWPRVSWRGAPYVEVDVRWGRCPDDGALVEAEGTQWSGRAGGWPSWSVPYPGFAPDGDFLVWVRHLDGVTHEAGVTHVVIDDVGRSLRHRVLDVALRGGQRRMRLGPGVPC